MHRYFVLFTVYTVPSTAIDDLSKCDKNIFHTVVQLLNILATLLMSVAAAERSLSTLKLVKICLCFRMQEDRLTSLCLLNVHGKFNISKHRLNN